MKKKILATILAFLSAGCLAAGLTACTNDGTSDTGDKWGSVYTVEAAYAEATSLGYGGTLEDFIESISGKDGVNGTNGADGVGISKIEIVSDNLKVTLTDGSVLELGSVKGDTGAQGEKGDTGAQGEKGEKGDDGESAYEIWLKNGHTGTEEDFLEWLKADGSNDNPQELDFYLLDDGTYGVSVYKAYFLSNVVIPSTHNGKAVSTVFGDGMVSLGGLLYSDIKSVVISEGIKTIGEGAFCGCSQLESITIPDSVTEISGYAFYECSSLDSITIPDGVTTIGDSAFYGCSSLDSITIPDGVTAIGDSAFYNCSSLASIAIPDGVTRIGINAFYGCSSLRSIAIPDSVTKIDKSAFSRCFSLESITIPDGVTSIGNSAFSNCTSLASITIPDSVTTIGDNAFYYCTLLESVYYKGTSEQWDGVYIYSNNEALTNATVYYYSAIEPTTAGNFWHYDTDGKTIIKWQAIENEEEEEIEYVAGTPGLEYTLSGEIYRCTGIGTAEETDITIANYYNGLPVTSVSAHAFQDCTSLTSVTIPDGVLAINSMAFYGCTSLESVSLGNSVRTVGNSAFEECPSLNYNEYDNGYYLGNSTNPYQALIKAKNTDISSCEINPTTKVIGYRSFEGCTSLTAIVIPDEVISINTEAFKDCTSLARVTMSEGITFIGSYAFNNCASLVTVIIPNSLQRFANNIFYGCTSLKRLYYNGAAEQWNGIEINDDNDVLKAATIYYYSATEPVSSGNFWHYAADGKTVVVW